MLITKQQPIATDLRMMMAALKFPQTLNVWVITQTHSSYSSSSKDYRSLCINSIKTMGKLAMLMLQDLNTATKQEDITLIKEIIERDKDIDDLYANIVNTTYLIDNDPL